MLGIWLFKDLYKTILTNNTNNTNNTKSILNLPKDIIEEINIFNGEGIRTPHILKECNDFWNRFIKRILNNKSLKKIITENINKCLCQYFINNKIKTYHYKSKYIQQFSTYPLIEKENETSLDELIIKFKRKDDNDDKDDNTYYYLISLVINLNRFIIKNEQSILDKNVQKQFIEKIKTKFNKENVSIIYKEDNYYPNKMKLMININFIKLKEIDIIKYNILLTYNQLDKVNLIQTFLKEKICENLLL